MKNMIRDKHVDVMFFWGILFVVLGHCYQPTWFFFPAYTFHIPFFFFISGYLFKVSQTFKEKMAFFVKKIRKQLIPYLLINFLFGVITIMLAWYGIHLGGDLSVYKVFVVPFITSHQYYLNIPTWFILNLFLVNVIAQVINVKNSRNLKIAVFVALLPITIFMMYKGLNNYHDWHLPIIRTTFALLFFQIGILFKEFKEKAISLLKRPEVLIVLWVAVVMLNNLFGNITYSIVWGNIGNPMVVVPLITTFLIICISFGICYHLSHIIQENSLVVKIGQNSFSIMVLHLSIFFLINLALYGLGKISFADLSTWYFIYKPKTYFILYESLGIFLPILLTSLFLRVKRNIPLINLLR